VAFVESLSPFFADFATAATLDGGAVTVIFDNGYVEAYGLASRNPQAMLPSADVGSAVQGSTLVIGSATYRVTSVQPDGTGVTTLTLELQ